MCMLWQSLWDTNILRGIKKVEVSVCPLRHAGDPDKWDTLLQLNLGTPMRLTRRLAPKMAGKPNHAYIINISSIAGPVLLRRCIALNGPVDKQ